MLFYQSVLFVKFQRLWKFFCLCEKKIIYFFDRNDKSLSKDCEFKQPFYLWLKGSEGQFLVKKFVPCQKNPFTLLWFLTIERVKHFGVFFSRQNETNTICWRIVKFAFSKLLWKLKKISENIEMLWKEKSKKIKRMNRHFFMRAFNDFFLPSMNKKNKLRKKINRRTKVAI